MVDPFNGKQWHTDGRDREYTSLKMTASPAVAAYSTSPSGLRGTLGPHRRLPLGRNDPECSSGLAVGGVLRAGLLCCPRSRKMWALCVVLLRSAHTRLSRRSRDPVAVGFQIGPTTHDDVLHTPMNLSPIERREFLADLGAGVAALATSVFAGGEVSPAAAADAPRGRKSSSGLAELTFRPLPLGSIRPGGWLRRQLRLQADGLSGHLDEFWPDVGQSQWFGGKAEGWERALLAGRRRSPWPGSWTTNRSRPKSNGTLTILWPAQRPDGWYAPYPADARNKSYDLWAILLANKALVQYHEATGDGAVLNAVVHNLKATLEALDRTPLFGWGKFRWFEGLIPVYYAYDQTGEAWLLDLARKLHAQGFDYQAFYRGEDVTAPTPRRGLWRWDKHVVNTGMALKAYGLSWRITRQETERAFAARMFEVLDRCHGQVTGMFTGDECLAGKNPVQGTELCAVVEAMYSLEHLLTVTGDPAFGDRLERLALNALPATLAPDLWSHQYDQQVNQVQCTVNPDHMWSTNGPESNLYGLEPNYGCCTSNLHQGWPKFAAHLWMRTPDDGIAAVAYAPSVARFEVRGRPFKCCWTPTTRSAKHSR